MYALLCGNLVLCCLRFLLLLAMFERIGVMVIIVGKIMRHDIAPFLVFATTAITAFESAAMFFSWILGLDHYFGYFFQMFTGVGTTSTRFSGDMFGANPHVPEWDTDENSVEILSSSFQLLFFVMAIVILMNLLVAMCALIPPSTHQLRRGSTGSGSISAGCDQPHRLPRLKLTVHRVALARVLLSGWWRRTQQSRRTHSWSIGCSLQASSRNAMRQLSFPCH